MEGIDADGISSERRCFEDLGLPLLFRRFGVVRREMDTVRFEPLLLSKLCKAFFFNKHQTVFRTKALPKDQKMMPLPYSRQVNL